MDAAAMSSSCESEVISLFHHQKKWKKMRETKLGRGGMRGGGRA